MKTATILMLVLVLGLLLGGLVTVAQLDPGCKKTCAKLPAMECWNCCDTTCPPSQVSSCHTGCAQAP